MEVFRGAVELGAQSEDLGCQVAHALSCPFGADKPAFDPDSREFWARGLMLHCFARQAKNLIRVSAAFQEKGWVHEIPDPLPDEADIDPVKRLYDTASALSEDQTYHLIQFSASGAGRKIRKIRWEFLPMPEFLAFENFTRTSHD